MTGCSHSTISSQSEWMSCEGLRPQTSTSQVTKLTNFEECHYNEGISGGEYCTVDIFENGDYFNDGNEEDCDFTDDQGVEA